MQELLVICIVGIALTYLGVKVYKGIFSKSEKCDGCAVNETIHHSKSTP